jgi:hypothetical protein
MTRKMGQKIMIKCEHIAWVCGGFSKISTQYSLLLLDL